MTWVLTLVRLSSTKILSSQVSLRETSVACLSLEVLCSCHSDISIMVYRVHTLLNLSIASLILIIKLDGFLLVIHNPFTSYILLHLHLILISHPTIIPIHVLYLHWGTLHLHLLLLMWKVMILGSIIDNYTFLIRIPHHITSHRCSKILSGVHIPAHWLHKLLLSTHAHSWSHVISIISQRHWECVLSHTSPICWIVRLILELLWVTHAASIHHAIISLVIAILITHWSLHILLFILLQINSVALDTWRAQHTCGSRIDAIGAWHLS